MAGGRISKAHPPFPLSLFLSFPFALERDGPAPRTFLSPFITWLVSVSRSRNAIHLSHRGPRGNFCSINFIPCENRKDLAIWKAAPEI